MATYYVISTTKGDDWNEAYRDKSHAEDRFAVIAGTAHFVRLIAVDGDESVELNRATGGIIQVALVGVGAEMMADS